MTGVHDAIARGTARESGRWVHMGIRRDFGSTTCPKPSAWAGQERTSRAPAASHVPGAPAHRGIRLDEPTGSRNLRSVWTITPTPFEGAHFATFPPELARRCVLAGSAPGDTVLDPFSGSGTTGAVATGNGRSYVGLELNHDYAEMSRARIGGLLTTIERAA